MDISGVILAIFIVIIILFVVWCLIQKYKKPVVEYESDDDVFDDDISNDDISDDYIPVPIIYRENFNNHNIKPYLIDSQYHNDFTYLLTAIKNLTPRKEHIFNSGVLPIQQKKGTKQEVSKMIKDYVDALNVDIDNMSTTLNENSGWDEKIKQKNVKSGWDKFQENIGFPKLWRDGADKGKIYLIDIVDVYRQSTDDEIQYTIEFILGQKNVSDQIVLSGVFVKNIRGLKDENNFNNRKPINIPVIIENMYVVGFLTNKNTGKPYVVNKHDLKDFDKNMTSKNEVKYVLNQKHQERLMEMENRNAALDDEGQAFHADIYG